MANEEAKRGTTNEGIERDRQRILYLHREWWEANNGLDIPRMARVFPEGDHYLMFNLQGHPYYGIAEKKKLWEFYQNEVEIDLPISRVVRLQALVLSPHGILHTGVSIIVCAQSVNAVPTNRRNQRTQNSRVGPSRANSKIG